MHLQFKLYPKIDIVQFVSILHTIAICLHCLVGYSSTLKEQATNKPPLKLFLLSASQSGPRLNDRLVEHHVFDNRL